MQPLNNNQIVMPLIRKSDWEKINMKLVRFLNKELKDILLYKTM